MAQPQIPAHKLQAAVNAVSRYGTAHSAAKVLGIATGTLQNRYNRAIEAGYEPDNSALPDMANEPDTELDPVFLQREVTKLRRELAAIQQHNLTEEWVRRKIYNLAQHKPDPPKWLAPKKSKLNTAGVPVLFLSDLHWGEYVNAEETGGINAYSAKIARERLKLTGEKAVMLLKDYAKVPKYPGMVVLLGGDMFSGDIHSELSETNELTTMAAVLDLQDHLSALLEMLANEFGRLFVVGVVGNHGRTHKKPRMKQRALTNFDWLLYQQLQAYFKRDERLHWQIPNNSDAFFKIYDWHNCLSHGDQFRGGGIGGPAYVMVRGWKMKRDYYATVNRRIDIGWNGHFHYGFQIPNYLVSNGSPKGADEYGQMGMLSPEAPMQTLTVVNDKLGMIEWKPLYLTESVKPKSMQWVSVPA